MCSLMDLLDKQQNIYLVVGATNNEEKTGFKVFKDLRDTGFEAVAVNARIGGKEEVYGLPSYDSVSSFLLRVKELFNEERMVQAIQKVVVVFVTPPEQTIEVLHEAIDHGVRKAWFQPGSESEEALALCRENGIVELHSQCIMVSK